MMLEILLRSVNGIFRGGSGGQLQSGPPSLGRNMAQWPVRVQLISPDDLSTYRQTCLTS